MNPKQIAKRAIQYIIYTLSSNVFDVASVYRYKRSFGRMPNLVRPKTFTEKLLIKKLFDRSSRLTLFADKYRVREFVAARLGDDACLTKIYHVVTRSADISRLTLPDSYVMKANHLSGVIKIVRDCGGLVPGELESLADSWLKRNYHESYGEWAYKDIKPVIMFEELLAVNGDTPDDYKFFCFSGVPQFIQVDRGRFVDHRRNFYDTQWSLLDVTLNGYKHIVEPVPAPQGFEKMLDVARALARGSDFIRVDLYNINGRIVFGELTNYPEAGLAAFCPASWDKKFGSYWK